VDLAGLWAVAWRSAALFVLSTLFFQPFHARFAMPYAAFERWKGPRTPLDAYLIIHGLFLFCIVSWLVLELLSRQSRGGVVRMLRLAGHYWDRLPRLLGLYRRLARQGREFDLLLGTVTAVLVLLLAWWVKAGEWFGIFLLLVILGTLLVVLRSVPPEAGLRWRMDPRRRFVWLLFGLGLVLSGAVDLVVLKGDIGRMNTVFKFYLQIWVFWSVAAAFALSEVAERLPRWSLPRRRLWLGALGVLLFLAVLYPVFAGKAKINDRFDASSGPSLDGMAYMKTSVYHDNQPYELKWDYDAINWLLDNVQGTPVIAEGNTEERGLYRWGSRISIYTGMPTILGWSWHQRQQRSAMPGEWIDRRLRDVTDLYRDSDVNTALNIIQKYDVRYIYVGELERDYYPGPGLDKFENMRAQGLLSLAYHNERVQIYEVTKK
jgi:YYY domain-containing protein